MEPDDGETCLTVCNAAAPVTAPQPGQCPGLAALPDALLHHVISMLAPSDTLRLRAVSRGLAAAVRTLPGGLFAQLSVALPDGLLDAEWCVLCMRGRFPIDSFVCHAVPGAHPGLPMLATSLACASCCWPSELRHDTLARLARQKP